MRTNPLCTTAFRLLVLVALGLGAGRATAQREANDTLQLPPAPPAYGFMLTNAFPGVNFANPIALASPPGDTNRLFVVERAGRIQVITNLLTPTKTLFLSISTRVDTMSEGGLLGLAFHPNYASNGRFFVYYTTTTNLGGVSRFYDRLSRFEVSAGDPNQALPESELVLFSQVDEAGNHNGGDIHFGPDGYLYVALGDEGGGGDNFANSRRIDRDFFAAILRLDVDESPGSLPPNPHPSLGAGYSIPADNPFVGATNFNARSVNPANVRTEFWAVGMRNPWRMSFDPATGWLYCGDVGQGNWEEVDIIRRGGDYGWNYREGLHAYSGTPPAGVTFINPIWEYTHSTTAPSTNRGVSVTGGIVYRGNRLSQLYGHYVFADYGSGNVWALHYDGTAVTQHRRILGVTGIVEFDTDPSNGDVLLVSLNGPIYRLIYNNQSVGDPLPETLADTGAFSDLLSLTPEPGIIPYHINVPFWSDQAVKTRWVSLPDTNLFFSFNPTGTWDSPAGTVWIKHFELELTNGVPQSARRLETRFLVRNTEGAYGLTYRWDDAQTNATLVAEEGLDETFVIHDGSTTRTQIWRYPARTECLICHTPVAGHALSFNTLQLNRDTDLTGAVTNQILALSQLGYLADPPASVDGLAAFASADDTSARIKHRVRSYLAVNCVQCHQPNSLARGGWDARYTLPFDQAGIVNGPLEDLGNDAANRVVVPGSLEHSMLLLRISELGQGHMPPLATTLLNTQALALLSAWITNDLVAIGLTLDPSPANYVEGSGRIPVDPQAGASVLPGTALSGLILQAAITGNAAAEDRLAISGTGDGPGQIGVEQDRVRFEGVEFARIQSAGAGSEPLEVILDTAATAPAFQALVRALSYENTSSTPNLAERTIVLDVLDEPGSTLTSASRAFRITHIPESTTLTWNNPADIIYGTALGDTQLNAATTVLGTFAYEPGAGTILPAGPAQTLSVIFTADDLINFLSATGTVAITVLPAPLTVTADDKTIAVGQPLPEFTVSYSGFVNGEGPGVLTSLPMLETAATPASLPGAYPITAGGAASANYLISYVAGVLTLEPNAQFGGVALGEPGQLEFTVTGVPDRIYRLESSPDLESWVEEAVLTAGPNGTVVHPVDIEPAGIRFYRIVWP